LQTLLPKVFVAYSGFTAEYYLNFILATEGHNIKAMDIILNSLLIGPPTTPPPSQQEKRQSNGARA
jgi:hypothetical protein